MSSCHNVNVGVFSFVSSVQPNHLPRIMKANQKESLRQKALSNRQTIPSSTRKKASGLIQNQLINHFSGAYSQWLVYRSMADEVATDRIFSEVDAYIFAPVTSDCGHMKWHEVDAMTRWQNGRHHVQEPVDGSLWKGDKSGCLIVCPLAGFDRKGTRLGLGLGCFDRWLAINRHHIACKVGLAFSCQEFESLPAEKHDIPLDYIITERELIVCQNN